MRRSNSKRKAKHNLFWTAEAATPPSPSTGFHRPASDSDSRDIDDARQRSLMYLLPEQTTNWRLSVANCCAARLSPPRSSWSEPNGKMDNDLSLSTATFSRVFICFAFISKKWNSPPEKKTKKKKRQKLRQQWHRPQCKCIVYVVVVVVGPQCTQYSSRRDSTSNIYLMVWIN